MGKKTNMIAIRLGTYRYHLLYVSYCYIDPLVAVLVSVVLLNENMTVPRIIGGVLILGFTLWSELRMRNKQGA